MNTKTRQALGILILCCMFGTLFTLTAIGVGVLKAVAVWIGSVAITASVLTGLWLLFDIR